MLGRLPATLRCIDKSFFHLTILSLTKTRWNFPGPEAALAAASEWVEVEDAKDGKIDSDSAILDENRPCKTSVDPYEMLLMPGAGLHRSLLDPEGPGSPKKYGITQNMAHLGMPTSFQLGIVVGKEVKIAVQSLKLYDTR